MRIQRQDHAVVVILEAVAGMLVKVVLTLFLVDSILVMIMIGILNPSFFGKHLFIIPLKPLILSLATFINFSL